MAAKKAEIKAPAKVAEVQLPLAAVTRLRAWPKSVKPKDQDKAAETTEAPAEVVEVTEPVVVVTASGDTTAPADSDESEG